MNEKKPNPTDRPRPVLGYGPKERAPIRPRPLLAFVFAGLLIAFGSFFAFAAIDESVRDWRRHGTITASDWWEVGPLAGIALVCGIAGWRWIRAGLREQ